ncbi:PKD domain-containing protein [Thermodesulfobacteriota bacterium]
MKPKNSSAFFIFIILIFLGGLGCSDSGLLVADAGENGFVAVGEMVILDGSASTDSDGRVAFWLWAFNNGLPPNSAAQIFEDCDAQDEDDITTATACFIPDMSGEYMVQLTVTDDEGHQASTTVIYTTGAPVAVAEVNGNHLIDGVAVLRSTSYDDDKEIVSLDWTFESYPSAEEPEIVNSDQEIAYFTPDVYGDYIVKLTVTDNDGIEDSTTVTYNVMCEPVAVAQVTGSQIVDEIAILIGSNSYDYDGEIVSWDWTFESYPSAEAPEIGNSDLEVAYFIPDVCGEGVGGYTVRLTVTDDDGLENDEEDPLATVTYNVPCTPVADAD